MRLILLDSNSWLSHYNVQLLQIELQCGPLDSKSQRCLTHSYALFEDCFQCPSHILHRIFTEHDVACKRSEQRIDSGICQISSFKLRGWGRLWHQRGFEWEGKGHVSLDQQIQLTQAPWKERNLLSEAAGLSIHVHHHLENHQFRPDVDITLNSELRHSTNSSKHVTWCKGKLQEFQKQAAFLKSHCIHQILTTISTYRTLETVTSGMHNQPIQSMACIAKLNRSATSTSH